MTCPSNLTAEKVASSMRELKAKLGPPPPAAVVVNSSQRAMVEGMAAENSGRPGSIAHLFGIQVFSTPACPTTMGFTCPTIESAAKLVELLEQNDWSAIGDLIASWGAL